MIGRCTNARKAITKQKGSYNWHSQRIEAFIVHQLAAGNMIRWIRKLAQKFALLTAIVIIGALLCATMIRFAPGYGMDERELNSGLSQASRNAIRSEYGAGESLTSYYAH